MTRYLFTDTVHRALGADFRATELSTQVRHVDVGAPAVTDLLTWTALSELLSTRAVAPPRMRLHAKGTPVPADRYTEVVDSSGVSSRIIRPDALYRELRAGASLVLDAVDRLHPPVRAAADDLMRFVRERVQVNLYVIWGDSHGFDTHWDDHDTFIVQLAGTKHWQVHGPGSRPFPLRVDADHAHTPPGSAPAWKGVLEAGHVLHVPRGWWHTVTGTGDASMHLTFGFAPATGIDWARWLVERLHERELFRRDLPRFASTELQQEWHRDLVAELTRMAEDPGPENGSIPSYLRHRDERFPRRQVFSLPWAVDQTPLAEDTVVEFAAILPPELESGSDSPDPGNSQDSEDVIRLTVSGRRYQLPQVTRPALETLIERPRVDLGELVTATGQDGPTVAEVVRTLARHHLVHLHPGPSTP
ncbi:cupin domain-containing protein [Lipingzhangella sp. LS1_29]|uniref:Cupin domain-containing protein n=1 Tax=Lipingzhangella rawalii TaxID=2055835 RepID=A0ABU2H1Q0_9ACTN|nr:cupin domain-containing protein [Lipingzhangella rawalii]MDS1269230.1 cupin domain-containing protein [Lipingzhangella rawalii]